MAKQNKTNAVRLLEASKIAFETVEYPVDPENLDARHVADSVGEDIRQVFKTLVLRGERNGLFVCVVPGNMEVDLKKAASAFDDKKVEMIAMKELLPMTGYIRGGCSPIGMKKPYPTFFHVTALDYDYIFVSAGVRGMQIKINPSSLISFTGADVADIAK